MTALMQSNIFKQVHICFSATFCSQKSNDFAFSASRCFFLSNYLFAFQTKIIFSHTTLIVHSIFTTSGMKCSISFLDCTFFAFSPFAKNVEISSPDVDLSFFYSFFVIFMVLLDR